MMSETLGDLRISIYICARKRGEIGTLFLPRLL